MHRLMLLVALISVPSTSWALGIDNCINTFRADRAELINCLTAAQSDGLISDETLQYAVAAVQSGQPLAAVRAGQHAVRDVILLEHFADQLVVRPGGWMGMFRSSQRSSAEHHSADPLGLTIGVNVSLLGEVEEWLGFTTHALIDFELDIVHVTASGGRLAIVESLLLVRTNRNSRLAWYAGPEYFIFGGFQSRWEPEQARPRMHGPGWLTGLLWQVSLGDNCPGQDHSCGFGFWMEGGQRFPFELGRAPKDVVKAYDMPSTLSRMAGGAALVFRL